MSGAGAEAGFQADPVLPRFAALSGASLPLAWELAWSPQADERVVRLTRPDPPVTLPWGPWPRAFPRGTVFFPAPGASLHATPTPFLGGSGPVTVLFGTAPPAFVELPEAFAAALARGATLAELAASAPDRPQETERSAATGHLMVGAVRLGLVRADPPLPWVPAPSVRSGAEILRQEAWSRAVRRNTGAVLTQTATGAFLRVGRAALRLWELAEDEAGVPLAGLPERLGPVAEQLVRYGMLRAVAPCRVGDIPSAPAGSAGEERT